MVKKLSRGKMSFHRRYHQVIICVFVMRYISYHNCDQLYIYICIHIGSDIEKLEGAIIFNRLGLKENNGCVVTLSLDMKVFFYTCIHM
jgi:hypothetical protein